METIPGWSGHVRMCRKLAICCSSSTENKARTPNTNRLISNISGKTYQQKEISPGGEWNYERQHDKGKLIHLEKKLTSMDKPSIEE